MSSDQIFIAIVTQYNLIFATVHSLHPYFVVLCKYLVESDQILQQLSLLYILQKAKKKKKKKK